MQFISTSDNVHLESWLLTMTCEALSPELLELESDRYAAQPTMSVAGLGRLFRSARGLLIELGFERHPEIVHCAAERRFVDEQLSRRHDD